MPKLAYTGTDQKYAAIKDGVLPELPVGKPDSDTYMDTVNVFAGCDVSLPKGMGGYPSRCNNTYR